VRGRRLALAVAVLLLCGACGDGDSGQAGLPTPSSPSTSHSMRPIASPPDPVEPSQLCRSGVGLTFYDSRVAGAPGAASARRAARPWLAHGEALGAAPGRHGRRLIAFSRGGEVRQVVTVQLLKATGEWFIVRTTGCLTDRPGSVRSCGDVAVFRGITYHRPTYDIPGPTDGIGVGQVFGQGSLPACADVTAYAGPHRLVGPVAPVTVFQQEEVPRADSVVTSPVVATPRIYDAG
jgi:hypothetical protein